MGRPILVEHQRLGQWRPGATLRSTVGASGAPPRRAEVAERLLYSAGRSDQTGLVPQGQLYEHTAPSGELGIAVTIAELEFVVAKFEYRVSALAPGRSRPMVPPYPMTSAERVPRGATTSSTACRNAAGSAHGRGQVGSWTLRRRRQGQHRVETASVKNPGRAPFSVMRKSQMISWRCAQSEMMP